MCFSSERKQNLPYLDEASEWRIASLVLSFKRISVLTITTEGNEGALKMQAASEGSECEELNRDERSGWPVAQENQALGDGPALLLSKVLVNYRSRLLYSPSDILHGQADPGSGPVVSSWPTRRMRCSAGGQRPTPSPTPRAASLATASFPSKAPCNSKQPKVAGAILSRGLTLLQARGAPSLPASLASYPGTYLKYLTSYTQSQA
ncbi:hypothetical protein Landi51_02884 [Colletotrichum acutatum]